MWLETERFLKLGGQPVHLNWWAADSGRGCVSKNKVERLRKTPHPLAHFLPPHILPHACIHKHVHIHMFQKWEGEFSTKILGPIQIYAKLPILINNPLKDAWFLAMNGRWEPASFTPGSKELPADCMLQKLAKGGAYPRLALFQGVLLTEISVLPGSCSC